MKRVRHYIGGFPQFGGLFGLPLTAIAVAVVIFSTGCTTPPPVPTDPIDACALPPATFAGWFQSGAVSLNGVVNPANSLVNLSPNCGFYEWSEQMFMWLTSPAPSAYGGGAHIFDSPSFFDVSPEDAVTGKRTFLSHTPGIIRAMPLRAAQFGPHRLPVATDRFGTVFEFRPPDPNLKPMLRDPSGQLVEVAHARLEQGRLVLFDQAGKPIAAQHAPASLSAADQKEGTRHAQKFIVDRLSIFVDPFFSVIDVEQGQANGSQVLEAQTASNGSLIYYATMVNDVYAYFLTGVKDGVITTSTPGQFPTTSSDLNAIVSFATAHGKGTPPFPDPNALAIEVKSSWVLAAGLPNLSSYITMTATIPTYDQSNPSAWTQNGQQTVQLAMVGMHVVGSTANHPEMVWATFEHVANTPAAAYSYNSTTGTKTVAQPTSGAWVFATAGGSTTYNLPHMFFSGPPNSIQPISPFALSPSDTLRANPWGIDGSNTPGNNASNTEVISMNNHVRTLMASGDVRGNYIMTGATWTIPTFPPSISNLGVGTNRLANSTMETYHQGVSNCFTCHVGSPNGYNPNGLSHVFGGASDGMQPLF